MPIFGINISSRNGAADHEELKRGRVRYANVRLTIGREKTDARAAENTAGFEKSGIPTGFIHEFGAENLVDAVAEADFFADKMSELVKKPQLFAICRISEKTDPDREAQTTAKRVMTFCDRLTRRIDVRPCVMGSREQLEAVSEGFKKLGFEQKIAFWEINNQNDNYICRDISREKSETLKTVGRQYREFGAIEGCKGAYELNFGYEELAKLLFEAKCGGDELCRSFIEHADRTADCTCRTAEYADSSSECTDSADLPLNKILSRIPSDGLIMKLADRVCSNRLSATPKPLRLMSYEKQLMLVRWQCGLTAAETRAINEFGIDRAAEIVRRICEQIVAGA